MAKEQDKEAIIKAVSIGLRVALAAMVVSFVIYTIVHHPGLPWDFTTATLGVVGDLFVWGLSKLGFYH